MWKSLGEELVGKAITLLKRATSRWRSGAISGKQYADKERQHNEKDNCQDDGCYPESVDQSRTAAPSMPAIAALRWPPLKLVRVHVAPFPYRLGFAL